MKNYLKITISYCYLNNIKLFSCKVKYKLEFVICRKNLFYLLILSCVFCIKSILFQVCSVNTSNDNLSNTAFLIQIQAAQGLAQDT